LCAKNGHYGTVVMAVADLMTVCQVEPHKANRDFSDALIDALFSIHTFDASRDAAANTTGDASRFRYRDGYEPSVAELAEVKQAILANIAQLKKTVEGLEDFIRTV
jgi:hypothetical protein